VSPSGGRVQVDLPADPPVVSVVAEVRFAGGSFGTGFQIGSRGHHDFATRYVAPAIQRERFLVHGREVVVAEADDRGSSLATLMGPYHELMTVYAGPAPRQARVFALFNSLEIEDSTGGMIVRPRSATLLDIMSELLVIVVKDRGSLAIPPPTYAAGRVPRFGGAPTKNGEVWKTPHPGVQNASRASDYSYLLGCAAGFAEVQLPAKAEVTQSQQFDWLNDIDVAWRAA
jgi:hypothetical protein